MQFPTMAEKAIEEWKQKTKTTSFNMVAKSYGAFRDDSYPFIEWIFDDDSRVEITGRGRNYRISAELP